MKLYMHPASTTCRPIMMFVADSALPVEQQVVDIMAGEQFKEPFASINPNGYVPVLEDGDFRLTESSAILKYLADKAGSPAYPKDLRQRAHVNELMDWFNTGFYRSFGYGLVYPQVLDFIRLPDAKAHALAVAAGKAGAERFLGVLDQHLIGPQRRFLAGDAPTIADYLGAGFLSAGEIIGCKFAAYPNIRRWYAAMQALPNWKSANAGVYGWADFARGPAYITV